MFEAGLAAGLIAVAASQGASIENLLRAADAPRRVIEEGVVRIQATLEEPAGTTTVSDLDVFVQGSENALCIFRGGPLMGRRILIAGARTWLMVPGSRRAIPISAGQRLLGGASIADVARLWFADTYTASLRPETETIDQTECKVLDLEARTRKAAYASGTLWIGAGDDLPRKAVFNLASGAPAKEVLFTDYGRRDGKAILERMQIRHMLPVERGQLTTLHYVGYEDRKLDPATFDPAGARLVP